MIGWRRVSNLAAAARRSPPALSDSSAFKKQLQADLKSAMISRNAEKSTLLKSILSELTYAQKATPSSSSSSSSSNEKSTIVNVPSLLQKLIKKRMDSIHQFHHANRQDLVEVEQRELELIKQYLPQQMSDGEIEKVVRGIVAELGDGKLSVGAVMKVAKGRIDGSLAAPSAVVEVVKRVLYLK